MSKYNKYQLNLLKKPKHILFWLNKVKNGFASVVGSVITIIDGIAGRVKGISIDTNIKQDSREGYNLLNILKYRNAGYSTTISGITFTVNKDGSITVNGTATADVDLYIVGSFTSSATKFTLKAGVYTQFNGLGSNGQLFLIYNGNVVMNGNNLSTRTFTEDKEVASVMLRVYKDSTFSNKTIYPMLVEGAYTVDTIPKYEQYGSMPSIEFPSEIKTPVGKQEVVVGNKNLFDINDKREINSNYIKNDDDSLSLTWSNINGTTNQYLNWYTNVNKRLKPNTDYYLVTEILDVSGTGSLNSVSQLNQSSQISKSVYYRFNDLKKGDIKAEKITTISSFSTAYTMLRTFCTFSPGQSGSITFRISVLENEPNINNFVYTPHQSQVQDLDVGELLGTIVDLTEEQATELGLDGEGSYFKDSWVRVILDGVTNKFINRSSLNENNIYNTNQVTELIKKSPSHDNNILGALCNYFKENIINRMITNDIQGFGVRTDFRGFLFTFGSNSEYNTLEKANQFLIDRKTEGNPIYIITPLATPTYTKLTDEQQAQWNKIKKMHTYEGVTHVFVTSEEGLNPILNLEYYKK